MAKYSIVVPLHNEEENVTLLYARLKQVMEQVSDGFEMVLVDDGSRDRTYKLLPLVGLNSPTPARARPTTWNPAKARPSVPPACPARSAHTPKPVALVPVGGESRAARNPQPAHRQQADK